MRLICKSTFLIFILSLVFSIQVNATVLRTGDLILQPLACWLCSLIESEENSIYSHMGIVLVEENNSIYVAEAFGTYVQVVSLDNFLKNTEKNQSVKILRSREIASFTNEMYERFSYEFRKNLFQKFIGLPYDTSFSWNDESIYCSELAAKALNPFLTQKILTKPMHFEKNRSYWERFFKHNIPDGKEGLSPADFDRSNLFFEIF